MRYLLAVETATARTGVALLRGDALVGEREGAPGAPAAEVLLPAIDALLADAGVELDEVEAFGVSIGPGSFTGLRIGLATVKGLAFGTPRPAVGVPTLAALALAAPDASPPLVPMLDARRDEVYAASYEPGSGREPGEAPLVEGTLGCSVYDAAALASQLPARCTLVGEGARICGEAVRAALGPGVALRPELEPRARLVGRLAALELARGRAEDPAALVPRYLRRAQAEVLRTGLALE